MQTKRKTASRGVRLTEEELTAIEEIEKANNGWLAYSNAPFLMDVLVDGGSVNKVIAVNREKKQAEAYVEPLVLGSNNELETKMIYGEITLERINEIN